MATQLHPLTQSFPAFLMQLYRHWYGLPRKSTQAWLASARLDLATALDSEESVDALRTFVTNAAQRPGVADLAADELAAVQRSLNTRVFAVLDAQKIGDLVELLTVDDPIGYAFGQWVYLAGRASETLAAVRTRLSDDVIDQLPASVSGDVEMIFTRLADERNKADPAGPAQFSPMAGKQRQAMLDALASLEANPTVLRIAWRELLAGKAASEPKTLGFSGSTLESFSPQASANAVEEHAPATPQSTRFHTDVNFPSQIKPGVETPLTVRLALGLPENSRLNEILDVYFSDPAKPELIDVVLDAPGFSERFDLWHRTMLVHADQDSEPVTFLLTADALDRTMPGNAQRRRIRVNFYHGGKHIGQGAFDVEIGANVRPLAPNVTPATGTDEVELRLVDLPRPADLELRVTHDPANQELHFMLHSTQSAVGYHWRRMGKVQLRADNPQTFFERQLAQINEWSGLLPANLFEGEATKFTRKLDNMGEELFERLFSPELKEAFWRDILPKTANGTIRTLLITSDEPWIPWELVKPYRYDAITDEDQESDFLSFTFEICRWLTGSGPYERVTIDNAGIVAPDVDLVHVKNEIEHLEKLADYGVTLRADLQTRAAVLEFLQAGKTRLLHVASHAQFDAEHPDASPLMLYDADLLPEDLDRRVIREWRKAKPLVFFNACEAGRIEYKLTGLGGWAEKFIRDVRATAFVGTLWQVNDALASEFAMVFYDELLAGQTLGTACHRARLHIKELAPANPTWLAYTLYGDPNTVVAWGTE